MGKILVIDDDADFLTMIKLLLGLSNFSVDTASSGDEGLRKLAADGDYDIVILDVMMPGMSGFEVCREIRKDERHIELPVVLLTAKGEKEDILEGIGSGANDYITKPFESEVLVAKIKSLIQVKNLQAELKQKSKMLENLAITDGLTGVYNHRYFYSRLNEEFEKSRRYGSELSCIMMDLDFFKKVNDHYGHMVGDGVLQELCQKVSETIRKIDIFARYGGEEFALILPQTGLDGAIKEAERIRIAVEGHHFRGIEKKSEITISLGVVAMPAIYIEKAEDMVKFADMALYEAKKSGRNRMKVYELSMGKGE